MQPSTIQNYNGQDLREIVTNIVKALPVKACELIHAVSVLGMEFNREFSEQVLREADVAVDYHVSQSIAFGIKLAYKDPSTYGADRYAALVGAYKSGGGAKIVVDCGTAVTVDAINSSGKHLGGLIIPGVELMCSVLSENASGIPTINSQSAAQYFNATTHDSVVSGSTLCLRHGLHSIIAKIKNEMESDACVYVTGGARDALAEINQDRFVVRPDLVLEGLQIMQKN